MFDDRECLQIFKSKFDIIDTESSDEDEDEDEDELKQYTGDLIGGNPNILEQLINNLNVKYDYLGFIAMELADGYTTLKTFAETPNYKTYQNYARCEIIMLAMEQKLLHCDFHNENILINPNYEGYFYDMTGKAMLIDFGIVKYITDTEQEEIRQLILENKYIETINLIYEKSIPTALTMYPGYIWFKQVTPEGISEIISLIQKRNQAKQALEIFSKEIRISNPSMNYPIIPLNLRLYQKYLPKISYGLFFGGNYNNNFYEPIKNETIDNLLEKILKSISIGLESGLIFDKKYVNMLIKNTDIIKRDVPNMIKQIDNLQQKISVVVGGKKRKTKRRLTRRRKTRKLKKRFNRNIC
jgi:serine/threonine protein kinase